MKTESVQSIPETANFDSTPVARFRSSLIASTIPLIAPVAEYAAKTSGFSHCGVTTNNGCGLPSSRTSQT